MIKEQARITYRNPQHGYARELQPWLEQAIFLNNIKMFTSNIQTKGEAEGANEEKIF